MGDVTEQPVEAGGGEEVMPDLAQLVELALEVQTAKVKQLEAAKKQQQSASTSAAGFGGSGGGLPQQVHKIIIFKRKKYKGKPDHTILQDWISRVRQFLFLHRVPEHQHVVIAAGFLDESALQWWRRKERWHPRVQDFAHLADLLSVQFIRVPFQGWVKFGGKPTWPPECLALAAAIRRNSRRSQLDVGRPAPGLPPRPGLREHQQAKPGTRRPGAAAAPVTGSASGSPHKARARQ